MQSLCTGTVLTRSNGSGNSSGSGRRNGFSASQLAATDRPGRRADPLAGAGRPVGVGPRLEAGQAVEVPALEVQALAVADAALGLPLLFGRTDLAGIDMKTHRPSIDTILFVDLSPGAAAVRDARLEVVDPVDRRHAAEPAVGLVVDVVPGELVHRAAPDDGLLAAVAEDHDEGVDRRRPVGVAEVDAGGTRPNRSGSGPRAGSRPVGTGGSGAGRSGPARTCGPTCTSRCSRTRRGGIRGGAGRWAAAPCPRISTWACHQWATTSARPSCSIREGFCRPSAAPSRARRRWYRTAPSETPRICAVWRLRLASLLQDLDRHDLLPCELCQGGASERALDVQDQLESPWLACRWMSSTTAVLNVCQARNDSGSLTPSFTGLVTRPPRDRSGPALGQAGATL